MVSKALQRKITEQPSRYNHLERMSVGELLQHINDEDRLVAEAVNKALPQIEALVEAIEPRMKRGGRCFISVQAPVVVWVSSMPANCLPLLAFLKSGWWVSLLVAMRLYAML